MKQWHLMETNDKLLKMCKRLAPKVVKEKNMFDFAFKCVTHSTWNWSDKNKTISNRNFNIMLTEWQRVGALQQQQQLEEETRDTSHSRKSLTVDWKVNFYLLVQTHLSFVKWQRDLVALYLRLLEISADTFSVSFVLGPHSVTFVKYVQNLSAKIRIKHWQ